MIETTTPTTEAIETRLADLRQRHVDLTASVAAHDSIWKAADEAVERAQAVFDVAVAGKAGPSSPNPYDAWSEPKPGEQQAIRDRIQRGEGAFEQADRELGAALVRRTTVSQARGFELMRLHQTDEAIRQAERDLELARQAPQRERDLLGDIRARIFGRAG